MEALNSPAPKNVTRTQPNELRSPVIAAMAPGTLAADYSEVTGFGSLKARCRATGTGPIQEFIYVYQRGGKACTLTLGRFSMKPRPGAMTLVQARAEALRLQAIVKAGGDPKSERELARAAAKTEQAIAIAKLRQVEDTTLGALCDEYVANLRKAGKHDSARSVEGAFRLHLKEPFPYLAALPAAQVTPAHVTHILRRLVGQETATVKGRTAVKLRSYLHAAYRAELNRENDPRKDASAATFNLTTNPVAPVATMAEFNVASERALKPAEFRQYLLHVCAHPSTMVRLGLLMQVLLAGQRVRQMLRMTWDDVDAWDDVDTSKGALTLRDGKGRRSKARLHLLPITSDVRVLLAELKTFHPKGTIFGKLRPETLSEAVKEISDFMVHKGTAAAPFRGGDIRRTIETLLAGKLDVSKDHRAQLLSHGFGGVQDKNYDKADYAEAKTTALRRWADYIADLAIGAPTPSNVVPLHAAA